MEVVSEINNEFDLEASVDYCIGSLNEVALFDDEEEEVVGGTIVEKALSSKSQD